MTPLEWLARLLLAVGLTWGPPAFAQRPLERLPQNSVGSGEIYNRHFEGDRSTEEVRWMFDRSKRAFEAIYKRAAIAALVSSQGGEIIVSLSIAPGGEVTDCTLVSSSFHSPDFERKVMQRVMFLRFQARDIPPFTQANYPIVFQPLK